jgi:adenosylcobinamide amidohydrolase
MPSAAPCLMRTVSPRPATVSQSGRWLVVRFPVPHRTLSWAIVGGGFHTTSTIAWRQVSDDELAIDVDPRALLMRGLADEGLTDAVGLLTGSPVTRAVRRTGQAGALTIDCLATVGLGNALRAGDPPATSPRELHPPRQLSRQPDRQPHPQPYRIGTINVCVWSSHRLSDEALVEAQALTAEARTAAMLAAGVPSTVSALPATGTGTDCQVVAAPIEGQPIVFVGKHTDAGHLIGSVVGATIEEGVARWLADRSARTGITPR